MKIYSKYIALSLLLAVSVGTVDAQSISFNQYIKTVTQKNTAWLAEKYDVDIAAANVQAAKVFNDPEFSFTYGNNQDWYKQMGQSVETELSYTINTGSVRKRRIQVAKAEKSITEASVEAYFSNLKSEAFQAWAEAWRLRESSKMLHETAMGMASIASADSVRLVTGDVGKTDALQTKIEAQTLRHCWLEAEAEYKNALLNLELMMGGEKMAEMTDEKLPALTERYLASSIYKIADSKRADLKAAELEQSLSASNLKLIKASRALDLGISLGYSYNTEVRNEIAPAPKFNGLSVGVTIPLKFSNTNKGELKAAALEVEKSKKNYELARQQVRMEVAQAYNNYNAAKHIRDQYNGTILKEASDILESRKVAYQSGESSLTDLLTAQQTYQEVMQNYIDACAKAFVSEVLLQQAMGI